MDLILALVFATSLLVAIPGPNVVLIIANALHGGFRAGASTVMGTTLGIAAQLVLVIAGLNALVSLFAELFIWLKWLGVAYLIHLGVRIWREPVAHETSLQPQKGSGRHLFAQGFLVAVINPKTLLFNAAFLPQFMSAQPGLAELGVVAGVYLTVLFFGDLAWAAFSAIVHPHVIRFAGFTNRVTGGLLIGSGVALAMSRLDR